MPRRRVVDDQGRRVWKRTNPIARTNGKPKRVHISNGSRSSALLESPIDKRCVLGRLYKRQVAELQAHLGNDITPPVGSLINQAARFSLLADLSWGEVMRAEELVQDGKPHASIDIFLKASKSQREVLSMLGIQRRARDVTLQDVLNGTAQREAS